MEKCTDWRSRIGKGLFMMEKINVFTNKNMFGTFVFVNMVEEKDGRDVIDRGISMSLENAVHLRNELDEIIKKEGE